MFTSVPALASIDLSAPVTGRYRTGTVELPHDASLNDVAQALVDHRVHAVLVRDEGRRPIGWATARGMLHNRPGDWSDASAAEAVSENLCSITADGTLGDAVDALLAAGASHVLVRDAASGEAIGVLADSDIVAALAAGRRARR